MDQCRRCRRRRSQAIVHLGQAQPAQHQGTYTLGVLLQQGVQGFLATDLAQHRLLQLFPNPRWTEEHIGFAQGQIPGQCFQGFVEPDVPAPDQRGVFDDLPLRDVGQGQIGEKPGRFTQGEGFFAASNRNQIGFVGLDDPLGHTGGTRRKHQGYQVIRCPLIGRL